MAQKEPHRQDAENRACELWAEDKIIIYIFILIDNTVYIVCINLAPIAW